MRVRGAPAIGIFAAFALYIISSNITYCGFDDFYASVLKHSEYLDSARPTAVNLSKQLRRMEALVLSQKDKPIAKILSAMHEEALKIQDEDIKMCKAISEYGLSLIKDEDGVMTHCNAGPLATSYYGTGLGPLLLAAERGIKIKAYTNETRPLLQGARLTTYELHNAGVDVTLICDNMASIVMKEGKINAIFVGCDRVARNGDVANKIGTSGLAILAGHYDIPFYVCCPSSTIDPNCKDGSEIEIELRDPDEIKSMYFESSIALDGVKCYNPSFDVTDNSLITAIITEDGIFKGPYEFD